MGKDKKNEELELSINDMLLKDGELIIEDKELVKELKKKGVEVDVLKSKDKFKLILSFDDEE